MESRAHIFLFLMATLTSGQPDSSCPPGWVTLSNATCVQFTEDYRLPWVQAQQTCQNLGASLLRFSSPDELQAFSVAATVRSVDGWWTDLNCIGDTQSWTWGGDEDVAPGTVLWAAEPTDNHHVENCVTMDAAGLLSDESCDSRFGFICTYQIPQGGSCNGSFTNYDGFCQYFTGDDETLLVSWVDARAECASLPATPGSPRATLATFVSADFYETLQTLAGAAVPAAKRWVGLSDNSTERQWTWSDGTRVTDTSFLRWRLYFGDTQSAGCGLVHSNGQMEVDVCEEPHRFACKLTVDPASGSEERDFGCPSPWIRGGRKCYLFNSNMSLVFQDARDFCARNKGRLLQVSSMDEKDWMVQQTLNQNTGAVWTGLRRSADSSPSWIWDDGTDADPTYINWSAEPNDDGPAGEDCAFLTPDGTYSDASCFYRSAFVCELESEDAPCPAGWVDQELDFMSLCYYVSNSTQEGRATRMEALFRCRRLSNRQEAHLVAINSQTEMDFVTSLIKGRPWDGYWTDLTDSRIEGLWQFSNPSDVSPPIPWAKEPNNRGGHENCVQMYPGGRYNDVNCDTKSYVLCEKSVPGVSSTAPLTSKVAAWLLLLPLVLPIFNIHLTRHS